MGFLGLTVFTPVTQSGVWQHVQTQVLGSPAASVTFSGLASDHFYQLVANILKDSGATNPPLLIRLNNDATAVYATERILTSSFISNSRTASLSSGATAITSAGALAANLYTGLLAVIAKHSTQRGQIWAELVTDGALSTNAEKFFGEYGSVGAGISRIDILIASGSFAAGTSIRLDKKNAA